MNAVRKHSGGTLVFENVLIQKEKNESAGKYLQSVQHEERLIIFAITFSRKGAPNFRELVFVVDASVTSAQKGRSDAYPVRTERRGGATTESLFILFYFFLLQDSKNRAGESKIS